MRVWIVKHRAALTGAVAAVSALSLGATSLVMAGNDGASRQAAPAAPLQGFPAPKAAMGLEIVGHHDLDQTPRNTSDVWVHKNIAYVGYRCYEDKGTSFVDVSDPASPRLIYQTSVMSQTFTDDIEALHLETAAFRGDLMIEPHDRCSREGPPAETRIWDVTTPTNPRLISSIVTGEGVHNAYPFQRGDKGYLILAAPFSDTAENSQYGYEDIDLDSDFTIVDITDPASPVIVSKWNAHEKMADVPPSTFQHDVWVNKAGTLAYGAYWDAGVLLLDISDVTNPTLVSQLTYWPESEGNTHQAVPTKNEDYVVISDEDFDPYDPIFDVLTPASLAGPKASASGSFGDILLGRPPVEGPTVWVGRGCSVDPAYPEILVDDPYLGDPRGKIAVIVRGACSFQNKVLRAQAAGAIGAIVVNNTTNGGPAPMGGSAAGVTIGAVGIGTNDGRAITTTQTAGTEVRVRFGIQAGEWGFTRVADYRDPANPRLVAEYTVPESKANPPVDTGTFSAHNAWIDGDLAYLSHYNAGVRVLDIADPTRPRETAYLIPGDLMLSPTRTIASSIWGVWTDERGYIYASDMTHGLWILRPTVPAQATATATVATSIPPPAATPTLVPPAPTPGGVNVCPHLVNKVPAAAIAAAAADPGHVAGYQQLVDPSKPHSAYNPRREWLSIRTYSKPYHPTFNRLTFKAGCP